MFYTKNDGSPMTAQERRNRYPNGICPMCGENHGWEAGAVADEGQLHYYYVECKGCKTRYPEEE